MSHNFGSMEPITIKLLEQLKPWITVNHLGQTTISHEGLLIWLSTVYPGWRVALADIHTIDTGLLAETNDGKSVHKVTSYIVSAHVLNAQGEVVTTALSSEHRAFQLDILKNPYLTDWPNILQIEAEENALRKIGISKTFLAMAVAKNTDMQRIIGASTSGTKSHPSTLAVSDYSNYYAVETLYKAVCEHLADYTQGMDFKKWVLKWGYKWEICPEPMKRHIVETMNRALEENERIGNK